MSYEAFLEDLAVGWWLSTFRGPLWLAGHGQALDQEAGRANMAVSARLINGAPADALYTLGAERGIETYSGEPLDSYRARVQGAWQFWQWSGTNTGIRLVMAQLGYAATITEHFHTEPGSHEFSVNLQATDVTPSNARFDDGVTFFDDGTPYDLSIRAAEPARLRGIIDRVKAAHSKLRRLTFTTEASAFYDAPGLTYDDGAEYRDITVIDL